MGLSIFIELESSMILEISEKFKYQITISLNDRLNPRFSTIHEFPITSFNHPQKALNIPQKISK
jgi:hypothetical protein